MIHSNVRIGVIYGGQGIKYARELKKIVSEMRNEGRAIDCVLIDDSWKSGIGTIDERIFTDLASCEYFVVFLTKDLEYSHGKYTSKPNVMFELGIALSKVGRDDVLCVAPFSSEDFSQSYLFASDIPTQMIGEISPDNSIEDIRRVFELFLDNHSIKKIKGQETNYESLLTLDKYRIDFGSLFPRKVLNELDKYSLKVQLNHILSDWITEKQQLNHLNAEILFVFERVIFLSFFSNGDFEKSFIELFEFEFNEDEYATTAIKILLLLRDYILMRKNPQYNDIRLQKCERMIKEINAIISNVEFSNYNPLIKMITVDYQGLAYLHASLELQKKQRNEEAQKMANLAINKLNYTLELCHKLNDQIGILQSYIYYNLARAYTLIDDYDNAIYNFVEAYVYRQNVSKCSSLPAYFCASFYVESFLSDIEKNKYMLKSQKITKDECMKKYHEFRNKIDIYQNSASISSFAVFGEFYNEIHNLLNNSEE